MNTLLNWATTFWPITIIILVWLIGFVVFMIKGFPLYISAIWPVMVFLYKGPQ